MDRERNLSKLITLLDTRLECGFEAARAMAMAMDAPMYSKLFDDVGSDGRDSLKAYVNSNI